MTCHCHSLSSHLFVDPLLSDRLSLNAKKKGENIKEAVPATDSVPAHISLEAVPPVTQDGAGQTNSSSVRHSLATLIPVACQSP
jgi:hypothetical protein